MQYANNYRPKLNSFGEPMRSRKYDALNASMEAPDDEPDNTEEQDEAPAPPQRRKILGVQASRMMGSGGGFGMSGAQRQAQSQAKALARKKARMAASYGMDSGY